jgi:hypothetical protein
VKYHDQRDVNGGKGKIVFDFTQQFIANLRELGIVAHLRERTFTLAPLSKTANIEVQQQDEAKESQHCGVYARSLPSLERTYGPARRRWGAILHFVALDDMRRAPQGGVIVLLDATGEDFKEDGILFGQTDPYPILYRKHPNVPKHSINVNSNDPDALEGEDYLDYSLIQLPDKDFARNLHVVLSELYLKCAIIHGTAHFPLPFLPDELAFVRRGRSGGETITTALWFADRKFHFANLADRTQSGGF